MGTVNKVTEKQKDTFFQGYEEYLAQAISSCKVFDVFKKPVDGKQKNFRDFHHDIMENQKKHTDILVCEYEETGPLLMKVFLCLNRSFIICLSLFLFATVK